MVFSVIVPCYNVEGFLNECVSSILMQSFSDFELLLIDDGSTDSTGEICDEWKSKDDRVCVFHKENGGLSDARNFGIDEAKGDYLIFIDGDDFIAPGSFKEIAASTRENPEVIITRLVEYFDKDEFYPRDKNISEVLTSVPSKSEAIFWIMNTSYNTWPAPKNIVSRTLILEKGLFFKKGFFHEDMDWTVRLCSLANNYAICSFPWYYHRMRRKGSITNSLEAKRIIDVLTMATDLIYSDSSPLLNLNTNDKNIIIKRIISSVYASINLYGKLNARSKYIVKKGITENKDLFKFANKKSQRLFADVMHVLGVSTACWFLNLSSILGI